MNIYAIHACECLYEGTHGMEDILVAEFPNDHEAICEARELSYEVMDSYHCIHDDLWENAVEYAEEYGDESRVETYYEQERMDNLSYEVWLINTHDEKLEKLNDIACRDFQSFIEEYGIKCVAQV